MGRQSERSTTWTCDLNADHTTMLTDGYQDTPPQGWRIIHVLPTYLNMRLEGTSPSTVLALCTDCYAAFRALFVTVSED